MNQKIYVVFFVFNCAMAVARPYTFEIGSGMDGAMRIRGHGLLRIDNWSFGLAGRVSPTSVAMGMAGFNSPFLALGHLSDAGLASELRNPSYTALGRLTEKTLYRADIRSYSLSRYGIGLFSPNRRMGIGVECRSNIDAGTIWITPIETRRFRMESLWTAGFLIGASPDSSWILDNPVHPDGTIMSASIKNSLHFN